MQFLEREKKLFLKRKDAEIKHLATSFEEIGFLFKHQKQGFKIVPLNSLKFALQSNKNLLILSFLMLLLSFVFFFIDAPDSYFLTVFLAFVLFGSIAFWRIRRLLAFEINLSGGSFTFKIGRQIFNLKMKVIVEAYIDKVDNEAMTRSTQCWDFNVEKNVLSDSKPLDLFTLSEIGNGEYLLVRNFCFYLMLFSDIKLEFKESK